MLNLDNLRDLKAQFRRTIMRGKKDRGDDMPEFCQVVDMQSVFVSSKHRQNCRKSLTAQRPSIHRSSQACLEVLSSIR